MSRDSELLSEEDLKKVHIGGNFSLRHQVVFRLQLGKKKGEVKGEDRRRKVRRKCSITARKKTKNQGMKQKIIADIFLPKI